MTKVTIKQGGRVGVLSLETDGKWTMTVDGKGPGTTASYYTTEQVERITATKRAAGAEVTVE